jgi:hypothetical protein
LLETLEQAAIDKDSPAIALKKIFGPGDRSGAAQESQIQDHPCSSSPIDLGQ